MDGRPLCEWREIVRTAERDLVNVSCFKRTGLANQHTTDLEQDARKRLTEATEAVRQLEAGSKT